MKIGMKVCVLVGKGVSVACSAALLLGSGVAYAASVKVGAIFPMSGNFATFGTQCFKGVELAVEQANAQGGINGDKIELVKADAADTSQAVSETRRLISREDVKAIFGTYASGLSYAATPVAELAGVPYFEVTGTADNLTERKFQYLFRASAPASAFGISSMEALQKIVMPHYKLTPENARIAIVNEDSLYGASVAKKQLEIAKKAGLNVVETIPYSAKTVDLSSAVLRLKQSKINVVMHTGYQNDSILLHRQMTEAGFKPTALVGGGGGYSLYETRRAIGDKLDGTVTTDFALVDINPEGARGLNEFTAAYKAKYKQEPTAYSVISYAGAKSFIDAMKKSKSFDKDDIRSAVMSMDEAMGSQATGYGMKYSENGQNTRYRMIIMQWQKGQLKAIYPESLAVATPQFKD